MQPTSILLLVAPESLDDHRELITSLQELVRETTGEALTLASADRVQEISGANAILCVMDAHLAARTEETALVEASYDIERTPVLFLLTEPDAGRQPAALPERQVSVGPRGAIHAEARDLITTWLRALRTPVTSVRLTRFGPLYDVAIEPVAGINVFIGANAAGKTMAMKAIYAVLHVAESSARSRMSAAKVVERMTERLTGLFRPDDDQVGRLVQRRVGGSKGIVEVNQGPNMFRVSLTTEDKLTVERRGALRTERPVFLPSREGLSLFEGFLELHRKYRLSFDDTYADLAEALGLPLPRGRRGAAATRIMEELDDVLHGPIQRIGPRFYRMSSYGNMEAHLLSEGLRKVGTLRQLLANGNLVRGGALFWDEPEANLNPRLIGKMAEVLDQLAAMGVQIFLSTHDYLLLQRLSLAAEYKTSAVPLRFFSFFPGKEGVEVETADTATALEHDDIAAEFAALYDHELRLAVQHRPRGGG
jgi:ABC-type branched-subunit amino acid transport system ATPase component